MAIPFVYVRAQGSHREIGRQIGETARDEVRASVAFFRDNFEALTEGRMTFAQAQREAQRYLEYARPVVPHLVDELEGLAEGSGVPFAELLVPNCGEEFTAREPVAGDHRTLSPGGRRPGARPADDRCTAVAVVIGDRHVIGHNMDWYTIDAPNNVLFDVTVPDGTRFMTIAGAPYLPMLAMNSHGIGNVSNSVYSTDNRIGIANIFVRRWSIEAASLEEARRRALVEPRARGTNNFFADTSGRLWDVETSATAHAQVDHSSRGYMAHTNHYALNDMGPYEGSHYQESRVRLATAEALLAEGVARADDPVELLARVLRSHEPSLEECICGHPDESEPPAEQGMTVGSMICDLDERRIYACAGPPCENEYQIFSMEED
jgi:isopenicillin-N N-acyltransferase like protein